MRPSLVDLPAGRSQVGDREDQRDDDQDVALPGFRFHPTDEELVGFYLKRKVNKKPISIEIIKQIDIYKYDPWDLPSTNGFFFGNFTLLHLFIFPFDEELLISI